MVVLILIGVILLLLYTYLTWHHRHWQKLGVASDEPSIIFGSVKDNILMRCNRAEIMDRLYRNFPGEKVVGWFNFRQPALLVRDPEIAQKVLITDFNYFRNNDIDSGVPDDPLSKNLFILKDDEWKRSRALLTPAFTAGKVKSIYPQMVEIGKELAEYLKKHPEELHVKETMSRYTSEIIAKCAFGIEGNSFKEDHPHMYSVGKNIFESTFKNNLIMMIVFFMPFLNKIFKFKLVPPNVKEFFNSILREIIEYRQKNNVERNDLMQYLIELKKKSLEVEKGNVKSDLITHAFSDDDVLSGCIMFFIEAYETSALVITHTLYYLAMHKDIQDKVRKEIDEEMRKGDISYEQLQEMIYLNAVLQETNRLFPVSHFLFKRCSEKYEMDIGGGKTIPIEKNTPVMIPVYGYQTDPTYWEDPLSFKPERFTKKEETQDTKVKSVFMPFGNGPRMCIGMRISTTLIKIALIHILSKLEVLPTSKTPEKIELDPQYFLTTHKGGIYLRFAERSQ